MKNRYPAITSALALTLFIGPIAYADVYGCRAAIEQYTSAKRELSFSLPLYANCIRDTRGNDDCSSEFQMLQFDQEDFENAVLDYETECI
jgi:hypothetical protein